MVIIDDIRPVCNARRSELEAGAERTDDAIPSGIEAAVVDVLQVRRDVDTVRNAHAQICFGLDDRVGGLRLVIGYADVGQAQAERGAADVLGVGGAQEVGCSRHTVVGQSRPGNPPSGADLTATGDVGAIVVLAVVGGVVQRRVIAAVVPDADIAAGAAEPP